MKSMLVQLLRSYRRKTLRVLVVSDFISATQQISFARPLARSIAEGKCRLEMRDAAWLAQCGKAGLNALWSDLRPTILVLSRYSSGNEGKIVNWARADRIAILAHLDDDLFAVPETLGAAKFKFYNDLTRLSNLRGAIDSADLLYASTAELGQKLSTYNLKPPIVTGDIYCSADLLPRQDSSGDTVIGYMGTSGHMRDLEMIVPELQLLLETRSDLRFETFGTIQPPGALGRFGDRINHHSARDSYQEFLTTLRALNWTIGLAPLQDTPFNRCKADTKWVEYTAAGIPVVASAGPVYERPWRGGAIRLAQPGHWVEPINVLLSSPDERERQLTRAREMLANAYNHQILERQLLGVFERAQAVL